MVTQSQMLLMLTNDVVYFKFVACYFPDGAAHTQMRKSFIAELCFIFAVIRWWCAVYIFRHINWCIQFIVHILCFVVCFFLRKCVTTDDSLFKCVRLIDCTFWIICINATPSSIGQNVIKITVFYEQWTMNIAHWTPFLQAKPLITLSPLNQFI